MKQAQPGQRRLELIGLDVAHRMPRLRPRHALPLLAVVLLAALPVTALRIDLIRMRYALAEAMASEQRIVDEQRALTVRLRQLRDPVRLTARARELGFVTPHKVIDLPALESPRAGARLGAPPPLASASGEVRP